MVEGFAWLLAEYNMPEIKRAFEKYMKEKPDIPAPADIIKIIKDFKLYDGIQAPDIEKLREYKARRIPLTPKQEALIA